MTAQAGGADVAAEKASVRTLLAGYSIEAVPDAAGALPAGVADLAPGTRVFVVSPPRADGAAVVATAAELARRGHRPVPHVVARQIRDRAALDDFLGRLAGDAGATEALVVAGGAATPAGDFASATAILATGLLEAHGFRRVGLAGHPAGHPDVPAAELDAALREKLRLVAAAGMGAEIVTQFCFEAAAILGWARRLADEGLAVPVRVGLAGPVSLRGLVRYAGLCGVPLSPGMAARAAGQGLALLGGWQPDRLVRGLAQAVAEGRAGAVAGVHLYAFGGIARAAAWANAVRDGRFRLRGDGLAVDGSG